MKEVEAGGNALYSSGEEIEEEIAPVSPLMHSAMTRALFALAAIGVLWICTYWALQS